ncbi:MAG: hypothetical protein WC346_17440 [Methanogenium sp.]|jgi:CRISPR/Cas system CMR-associated protein Cmr5 small subunit
MKKTIPEKILNKWNNATSFINNYVINTTMMDAIKFHDKTYLKKDGTHFMDDFIKEVEDDMQDIKECADDILSIIKWIKENKI